MNAQELMAKANEIRKAKEAERDAERTAEREALANNIRDGLKLLEPYIIDFYSENSDEHEFHFSIAYGENEEVTLTKTSDEDCMLGYDPKDLVLTGKYIYSTIETNIILGELGWTYSYSSEPNVVYEKLPHELGIISKEACARIFARVKAEQEEALREYCKKTGQECPV
jgi:hypothetical protein